MVDKNETLIQITNYHSIEKAKINVKQGITAIIGKTNAGKSSIMRAVDDLINNGCGDSDVKIGTDVCTIAVRNAGHTIKLIRDPNKAMKTTYIVDGEEISKVGRNKPEETDLLGLTGTDEYNLNIIKQEDLPFLIYENNYRLYEFMSQSKSKSLLDAQNTLKETKKELNKDIKRVEAEINEIKNQHTEVVDEFKKYPKIGEIKILKDGFDKKSNEIKKIVELKDNLEIYVSSVKDKEKEIDEYNKKIEILNKILEIKVDDRTNKYLKLLEDYKTLKTKLDETKNKINSIIDLKLDFNYIYNTVKKIEKLNDLNNKYIKSDESLSEIKSKLSNIIPEIDVDTGYLVLINKIRKEKEIYETNIDNISNFDKRIYELDKTIEETEIELSKHKVCPTCGQLIDNCTE